MTRKDYVNIANVISVVRENPAYEDGAAMVARVLCGMLKQNNAAFNEARFLAACKPTGATV